jgi:flavodoxin
MKIIIIYSSRTGNTKKVAEAIYNKISDKADIYAIEEITDIDINKYDFIAIGFWVNRGTADLKTLDLLKKIEDKNIALFGTLGAYPDSKHAERCINYVTDKVNDSNRILGTFLCQGKIAKRILKKYETNDFKSSHPMTDERRERIEEGEKHPDENDLLDAEKFIINALKYIK